MERDRCTRVGEKKLRRKSERERRETCRVHREREREREREVGRGEVGWTDDRFGSGWKKGVGRGIEQEEKTDEVSGPLDW